MTLLYHEKQTSMLCGVHALNTLLQGPYFSAQDLGAIAQEFDERERALMREAGVESEDFLKYMAEDSGNAAADGNFSIQVLTKALEVWDLVCHPATSQAAGRAWQEPQNEGAFLCNLDQHWFTVRRCDVPSPTVHGAGRGCWWNFNSMFPAPQPISELYLGAFLAQLREEGYSIFVVRGALAASGGHGMAGQGGEYGRWWSVEEAAAANKQADAVKAAGRARHAAEQAMSRIGVGGSSTLRVQPAAGMSPGGVVPRGASDAEEDAELQAAIAASLGQGHGLAGAVGPGPGPGPGGAWGVGAGAGGGIARGASAEADADLAAAIAASLVDSGGGGGGGGGGLGQTVKGGGGGAGGGGLGQTVKGGGGGGGGGLQARLAAAAPVPAEPSDGESGTVMLAVRIPSGTRLQRRFRDVDTVGSVAAFAAAAGVDMSRHVLTTSFPRKQLRDLGAMLKDAGIKDKEALSVEPDNARER